jgi:superfamily II DNA or RNA helicase
MGKRSTEYDRFIEAKSSATATRPVPHGDLADHLFPHQRDLVVWALRRGRAAIFADTGLGKTAMFLEWARHCSAHGRVLVLAPLAVAEQIVREGERFGVVCRYLRADDGEARIVVTNYEMISHFDARSFIAVVIDESSILKAFNGKTRTQIIDSFSETTWRLACTATPAPNDYTELGNHSEFLGIKSRVEMLAEYFVHDGGSTQDWRIKGHAKEAFWRWVAGWGAVVKRPSDLGHSDEGFALPPLRWHERVIDVDHDDARSAGMLFLDDARTLADQRATRRATMAKRVALAAELADCGESVLVWCELNAEADAITAAIPGAVQVKGSDTPNEKAERLLAFAEGRARVLVSKLKIAGFGLNFQVCTRQIFAGVTHSYEQTYQGVRRSWRFGQTRPVDIFVLRAETEGAIVANLRRKEADAERMSEAMASQMRDVMHAEIGTSVREWNDYKPAVRMRVPAWIREEAA